MTKPTVAIWWLSPRDFQCITRFGALPTWLPDYVQEQFDSALGRNGRGRLWVPKAIESLLPPRGHIHSDCFEKALGMACGDCAGIVIEAHVVPRLINLPGLVTDFDLSRWDAYA